MNHKKKDGWMKKNGIWKEEVFITQVPTNSTQKEIKQQQQRQ